MRLSLADTWIRFNATAGEKRTNRHGLPPTLHCGLCNVEVVIDQDFDIESNNIDVIERENVDDGGVGDPDGLLQQLGSDFPDFRLVESRILCLDCVGRHVPELAAVVTSYRQLRAKREALLDSAH